MRLHDRLHRLRVNRRWKRNDTDKWANGDKDVFQVSMTLYKKLHFPERLWCRSEIILKFSVNMNLKPRAKFHENQIKTLRDQTIWNLTLAMSVFFPSCNDLLAFVLFIVLDLLHSVMPALNWRITEGKRKKIREESKQNVYCGCDELLNGLPQY